MSVSFPTQGYYVYFMCPDIIFPIFLPPSRPMISHHVISHVTSMSRTSLLSKINKKNQYKIRKIKEKKNKNC